MSLHVNLGSGQRPFGKPWINVDTQARWKPDVVANGADMPMFEDNSADLIVAHHVIEHVGLGEFDPCIRECYRILKPGGSLIVTTPDLYELGKAWFNGHIDDYIYCVNLYGAYMNEETDRHRWLYTNKTLSKALRSAAQWATVKPFDWRPIEGADIARDWYILGVEAVK